MGTGGPCAVKTPTFSFIRLLFELSLEVGIDLFSRHASVQVSSAQHSLTSVFGMGTGGPCALKTPTGGESPLTKLILSFGTHNFYHDNEVVIFLGFSPARASVLGAPPGTRTPDPLIKSQLLYQLS